MAEKTEKATPKKLRDARQKGQVAKSQDFASAFTFVVSIASVLILADQIYERLSSYMVSMFDLAKYPGEFSSNVGAFCIQAIEVIAHCSFPTLVLTMIVGVFVNFIIVGPLFSLEVIKPKLDKLNPINNLKNLFKMKTLFELLKSLFKITGAIVIVYYTMKQAIPEILGSANYPIIGILTIFSSFLFKLIVRIGIFYTIVAIADLVYQRRNFANEMKMEKFEVKQEYKDTEGDPHIKSRRRQTAHEIAYQEGPRSVKRAKTVITNPTHLAVALEYDEAVHHAPKILTMGQGLMAEKIIAAAIDYHVPIMRNVTLAQTLFATGKIGQFIPEGAYEAVAEILRWLKGLEESDSEIPDIFK
jgi:type III secretion YscU/HrpY family protein